MKRKFNIVLMLLVAVLPLLAACGAADTSTTASAQPSTAASAAAPASESASTAPEASEAASTAPEASEAASTAPEASEAASTAPEASATASAAPAGSAAGGASQPFTIGISNPFISSEYRTQMIQELIDTNKEYMDQGITNELVIESADTDVAGQIQQLQNLISKDVDAILVNPGDVNGLNATLQEAINKGIIVISVDQELDTPERVQRRHRPEGMGQDLGPVAGRQARRHRQHRPDRRLPRPPGQRRPHERRRRSARQTIPTSKCSARTPASGTRPPASR